MPFNALSAYYFYDAQKRSNCYMIPEKENMVMAAFIFINLTGGRKSV